MAHSGSKSARFSGLAQLLLQSIGSRGYWPKSLRRVKLPNSYETGSQVEYLINTQFQLGACRPEPEFNRFSGFRFPLLLWSHGELLPNPLQANQFRHLTCALKPVAIGLPLWPVTPLVTPCDTCCDTLNTHKSPVVIGL
jgi:hypothetical protein